MMMSQLQPIAALSKATVRKLGSAQVILDPAAAVKELIENAIDAAATSVVIEIASNTVDSLQVRDNGYGVLPEDRAALCRRYCTSKIRDYADIKSLGGTTLGFRGEALSSLAAVCRDVFITSRVEGEIAAEKLHFDPNGEVSGAERVAQSIGTCVRVANIFERMPIRRQTAIKDAIKYLQKLSRLLHSFALSRPNVRLSLRVLNGKNDKDNFLYAPSPNSSVIDAASKLFGAKYFATRAMLNDTYRGYTFEAFVPGMHTNASSATTMSCHGQFLFVDSRPVSGSRGIFKQITAIFKDQVKLNCAHNGKFRTPFLYLNICGPPGSYDPNVEPCKDNVIFEEPDTVLEGFKRLLEHGILQSMANSPVNDDLERNSGISSVEKPSHPRAAVVVKEPQDMLLGKFMSQQGLAPKIAADGTELCSLKGASRWHTSRADIGDDHVVMPLYCKPVFATASTGDPSGSVDSTVDPWVIAKLTNAKQVRLSPAGNENFDTDAPAIPTNLRRKPSDAGPVPIARECLFISREKPIATEQPTNRISHADNRGSTSAATNTGLPSPLPSSSPTHNPTLNPSKPWPAHVADLSAKRNRGRRHQETGKSTKDIYSQGLMQDDTARNWFDFDRSFGKNRNGRQIKPNKRAGGVDIRKYLAQQELGDRTPQPLVIQGEPQKPSLERHSTWPTSLATTAQEPLDFGTAPGVSEHSKSDAIHVRRVSSRSQDGEQPGSARTVDGIGRCCLAHKTLPCATGVHNLKFIASIELSSLMASFDSTTSQQVFRSEKTQPTSCIDEDTEIRGRLGSIQSTQAIIEGLSKVLRHRMGDRNEAEIHKVLLQAEAVLRGD